MNKKQKATRVAAILREVYPDAVCSLEYNGEPWRLLVMGRLSAQCTDARVNEVCRRLFERFPTPRSLAEAGLDELEDLVRPCGLHKTKAKSIKEACAMLCRDCDGVLPDNMDSLLLFPGVGRKIANLLLGDIYGKPAIVADTHCIRISGRLGLTDGTRDPLKTERQLTAIVEPKESSALCHRLVLFGREYCSARAPRCGECPLAQLCSSKGKNNAEKLSR